VLFGRATIFKEGRFGISTFIIGQETNAGYGICKLT
jgi:hypothetical protein